MTWRDWISRSVMKEQPLLSVSVRLAEHARLLPCPCIVHATRHWHACEENRQRASQSMAGRYGRVMKYNEEQGNDSLRTNSKDDSRRHDPQRPLLAGLGRWRGNTWEADLGDGR
jgi:hypothetical protein